MVKLVLHCDDYETLELSPAPKNWKLLARAASKHYKTPAKDLNLCYFNSKNYQFCQINSEIGYKACVRERGAQIYIAVTLPNQVHKFTLPEHYYVEEENKTKEIFARRPTKPVELFSSKPKKAASGTQSSLRATPSILDTYPDITDLSSEDLSRETSQAKLEKVKKSTSKAKYGPEEVKAEQSNPNMPIEKEELQKNVKAMPLNELKVKAKASNRFEAMAMTEVELEKKLSQIPKTKLKNMTKAQKIEAVIEEGSKKLENLSREALESKILVADKPIAILDGPVGKTTKSKDVFTMSREELQAELQKATTPFTADISRLTSAHQDLSKEEMQKQLIESNPVNTEGMTRKQLQQKLINDIPVPDLSQKSKQELQEQLIKESMPDLDKLNVEELQSELLGDLSAMSTTDMTTKLIEEKTAKVERMTDGDVIKALELHTADEAKQMTVANLQEQFISQTEANLGSLNRTELQEKYIESKAVELKHMSKEDLIMQFYSTSSSAVNVESMTNEEIQEKILADVTTKIQDLNTNDLKSEWISSAKTIATILPKEQLEQQYIHQKVASVEQVPVSVLRQQLQQKQIATIDKLSIQEKQAQLEFVHTEKLASMSQSELKQHVVQKKKEKIASLGEDKLIESIQAAHKASIEQLSEEELKEKIFEQHAEHVLSLTEEELRQEYVTQPENAISPKKTQNEFASLSVEELQERVLAQQAAGAAQEPDENLNFSSLAVSEASESVQDNSKVLPMIEEDAEELSPSKMRQQKLAQIQQRKIEQKSNLKKLNNAANEESPKKSTTVKFADDSDTRQSTDRKSKPPINPIRTATFQSNSGGLGRRSTTSSRVSTQSRFEPVQPINEVNFMQYFSTLEEVEAPLELFYEFWEAYKQPEDLGLILKNLEAQEVLTCKDGIVKIKKVPPTDIPEEAQYYGPLEKCLCRCFKYDDNDPASYETAVKYISSVKAYLDNPEVQSTMVSFARFHLLMRYGEYLHCLSGKPESAVTYFEQAVEVASILYVDLTGNPELALAHEWLGRCYIIAHQLGKAELHFLKSLEVRYALYGEDHPDIAISWHCLGNVAAAQRNLDKAIELHTKALELKKKHLEATDPQISYTLGMLAGDYIEKKDFEKALEYQQEAYNLRIQVYPEDHPRIADINFNMATTYIALRRIEEAHSCIQKAYEVRLKLFGPTHYTVAICRMNMAKVYALQNKFSEAIGNAQEAKNVLIQLFGGDHPQVKNGQNLIDGLDQYNSKYSQHNISKSQPNGSQGIQMLDAKRKSGCCTLF